ncbi:MAG: helical backbone metal receptor [Anaerolineae bacterium]
MSEPIHTLNAPLDTPPKTVVSLVPSITESLFDLNLGNRLIGRTDYCVYPADRVAAVPALGGTKNPDVERIIDLQPELIFANAEENREQDVQALRDAGIPVWVSMPIRVADVFTLLWNIMYLFDETAMVPRIRLIEQVYDRLLGMNEARTSALPKVFVPIWYNPLMTINQHTYMHDLLQVCGAWNVFAERERLYPLKADLGEQDADPTLAQGRDTRYPRVTFEEVEQAQPDVILLPSEPFAFTEIQRAEFKKLDVPATDQGRIHLVDGSWLTWHGTRLAYALNDLPALLRVD